MNSAARLCDLCGLPVGSRPFELITADKTLQFCCEGCLGIYQMLHDIETLPLPSNSSQQPRNQS